MSQTIRTFIAVEVPPEVRDCAAKLIARLKTTGAKVKWVDTRQMHWTLKFLGDVDMREIPEVCKRVSAAASGLASFDIEARGVGAFPDVHRPRTVWIGAGEGTEPMVQLHDALDAGLADLGYRAEQRRFRPHLTIGRVREGREGIAELGQLIQENAGFEGGLAGVVEVLVISSQLGREGPHYETLCHVDLKAR